MTGWFTDLQMCKNAGIGVDPIFLCGTEENRTPYLPPMQYDTYNNRRLYETQFKKPFEWKKWALGILTIGTGAVILNKCPWLRHGIGATFKGIGKGIKWMFQTTK